MVNWGNIITFHFDQLFLKVSALFVFIYVTGMSLKNRNSIRIDN